MCWLAPPARKEDGGCTVTEPLCDFWVLRSRGNQERVSSVSAESGKGDEPSSLVDDESVLITAGVLG